MFFSLKSRMKNTKMTNKPLKILLLIMFRLGLIISLIILKVNEYFRKKNWFVQIENENNSHSKRILLKLIPCKN